jgi:hypothetical protein
LNIKQEANLADITSDTLAFGSIDVDGNLYSSVNISYTDNDLATVKEVIVAHSINLDGFDGKFNLTLDLKDRDDNTAGDASLKYSNFIVMSGVDQNDTITFSGANANLFVDLSDAGTLSDLYADAIVALENTGNQISYFYGAIDTTDGYLFYDRDDSGITQVIKLEDWNAEMLTLNNNALIEDRFDNLINGLATIDITGLPA